ncbi:transcription factor kayak [Teleopsis dalmanni]|uniref:transcription factor kayak n=1 Tax=Teleopsis dalmanni TaxID=139649 RepID=UPI0018CD63F2|nr:transcription factor kayak [Teleopsis dalmanni]
MHFWIDKRSQQCGFGRSRVAASLSGAGTGLGFGHPPRRIGGNKIPSIHRQQQQHLQHNQSSQNYQQHYQHHHHHPQTQQQQSNNSTTITTTADCHFSRNFQHSSNNNNLNSNVSCQQQQQQQQQQPQQQQQSLPHNNQHINNLSNTNNRINSNALQITYNINNNPQHQQQYFMHQQQQQQQQQHHQQQHQQQQHQQQQQQLIQQQQLNQIHTNGNNNDTNATAATASTSSSAAILTGAGTTIIPRTTRINHYHRSAQAQCAADLATQLCSSVNAGSSSNSNHIVNYPYDTRSYHHPQFGNMSVRHYQHTAHDNYAGHAHHSALRNNIPYASQQQQQITSNANTANNSGTVSSALTYRSGGIAPSHSNQTGLQHLDQQTYRQQQQVYGNPTNNEHPLASTTAVAVQQQIRQTTTSYVNTNASSNRTSSYGNTRSGSTVNTALAASNSTNHHVHNSNNSQILPTHLKCGMCASLVLASIFVAGAKFYFDHQGSGLEILIFCAFSATFFLAACTVSLCRIPKGLMPARSGGGTYDEHGRALCTLNSGIGGAGASLGTSHMHGGIFSANAHRNDSQAAAQAGPPPYHIAILLPENSKELPLDESPPPSYDKILI